MFCLSVTSPHIANSGMSEWEKNCHLLLKQNFRRNDVNYQYQIVSIY